jgi:hypothetical protein
VSVAGLCVGSLFLSSVRAQPTASIVEWGAGQAIPYWYGAQWLNGDQQFSFRARRWSGTTIVEGGLYIGKLLYDASGNIIGLTSQPAATAVPFPFDANGWPTVNTHTFSPDAGRVAYPDNSAPGLWVADLNANTRTQIYASGISTYLDVLIGTEPEWPATMRKRVPRRLRFVCTVFTLPC